MSLLITDQSLKRRLLKERRASGGDRYDEVWNGVYVMSPLANSEHQYLSTRLSTILDTVVGMTGQGAVFAGSNVSDRDVGWEKNYRVPDVVVVMQGGIARMADSHCVGGPDFLIEVRSKRDRSRKKLAFYAGIGVREMMVVDRNPWEVELYRLDEGELKSIGRSTLADPSMIVSEVVPLSFRLIEVEGKPQIEVVHRDGMPRWVV